MLTRIRRKAARIFALGRSVLVRPFAPAARLLVIVPVYNVAQYLDECFTSVLNQTFRDFVVVAVDDGSTDDSAAKLATYRAQDRRIRIIRQRNSGLGAARNTGLKQWRLVPWRKPPYVTFLDPDDVLPLDAFERYFASIKKTGSVLCVGAIERFTDDISERWKPFWISHAHRTVRNPVTVRSFPDALRDIVACNRMIQRKLWDETVGYFPTDIAYEDHVPTMRLYLKAPSFDILRETTYLWRQRVDGTSIAQQKHQVENLADRDTVHEIGLREVTQLGDEQLNRSYVSRVIDIDLPGFVRRSVSASDQYRQTLSRFATNFVNMANRDTAIWEDIAAHRGLLTYLAAHQHSQNLAELTELLDTVPSNELPVTHSGGKLVLDLDRIAAVQEIAAQIPLPVKTLSRRQQKLNVTLEDVTSTDLVFRTRCSSAATAPITEATITIVDGDVRDQVYDLDQDSADSHLWRLPLAFFSTMPDGHAVAKPGAIRLEFQAKVCTIALVTRRFNVPNDLNDKINGALEPTGWRWVATSGQLRWSPAT